MDMGRELRVIEVTPLEAGDREDEMVPTLIDQLDQLEVARDD